MAASSPLHVETAEAWTTESYFSEESKTIDNVNKLPQPKRRSVFRVGGLVAVVFVLALLSAIITCSQVFKKRVTKPHESMGRRLAAGGEEEEEEEGDDEAENFLDQVYRQCVGWRGESEDTAGGDAATEDISEEFQEIQHTESPSFLYEESYSPLQAHTEGTQASTSRLSKESVPGVSPPLREMYFLPQSQQHLSQSEGVELGSSQLPEGLRPTQRSVPGIWRPFDEPSTDVSTSHHPRPLSPLETRAREGASSSQLIFGDSPESKRRKMMSTEKSEGAPSVFAGFSSFQQSTVTTEQQHQQSWEEQASGPVGPSPLRHYAWVYLPATAARMREQRQEPPLPHPSHSIAPSTVGHSARTSSPEDTLPITRHHYPQPWPYSTDSMLSSAMSHSAYVHPPAPILPTLQEPSSSSPHLSQQLLPAAPAASLISSASVSQPSSLFPLPPPAPPMPPTTHPYYRLPIVRHEEVYTRFSKAKAFGCCPRNRATDILPLIRRLLAQQTMNGSEANELILACELLAGHLRAYHTTPLLYRRPCFAAASLARRYLSLEAIFCTIQILGFAMGAEDWWPQLVQMIPTDYVAPTRTRKCPGAVLAYRLSSALASLKKGIRPSLEATVKLKRELFKGSSLKLGFEAKMWDPWRKDDEGDAGPLGS
ncbi:hypothetical protein Emed_003323 [Eimeria media]